MELNAKFNAQHSAGARPAIDKMPCVHLTVYQATMGTSVRLCVLWGAMNALRQAHAFLAKLIVTDNHVNFSAVLIA